SVDPKRTVANVRLAAIDADHLLKPPGSRKWHSISHCFGAQQHCPSDVVVWLNLPTMIRHTQGERWDDATKNGTQANSIPFHQGRGDAGTTPGRYQNIR